jgi:hypothetical protein
MLVCDAPHETERPEQCPALGIGGEHRVINVLEDRDGGIELLVLLCEVTDRHVDPCRHRARRRNLFAREAT